MENKSAEEVLKDTIHKYFSPNTSIGDVFSKSLTTPVDTYRCLIQTMREYAQQEAVAFHYWMDKSSEYREVSKNQYRNVAGKIFTTEELYQQFLTDKLAYNEKCEWIKQPNGTYKRKPLTHTTK